MASKEEMPPEDMPDMPEDMGAPETEAPADAGASMPEDDMPPEDMPIDEEMPEGIMLTEADIPALKGLAKGDMITLLVDDVTDDGQYKLSVKE